MSLGEGLNHCLLLSRAVASTKMLFGPTQGPQVSLASGPPSLGCSERSQSKITSGLCEAPPETETGPVSAHCRGRRSAEERRQAPRPEQSPHVRAAWRAGLAEGLAAVPSPAAPTLGRYPCSAIVLASCCSRALVSCSACLAASSSSASCWSAFRACSWRSATWTHR